MEVKMIPPISVHVGDLFDILVPSNPGSTGFVCTLDKMPECVNLVSKTYVPGHSAGIMGVPGNEMFKFVAIKKGHGEIEFNHIKFSRPLEILPNEPEMEHQMEHRRVNVE
jgi:predicted secreted protein